MLDYRMSTDSTAVARAVQTGIGLAEVSVKAGDMAMAANTVVGERIALMAKAALDPLTADYTEFSRMLPEKVAAAQQAGVALVDEWWTLQRDIGDYMGYVARSMISGWPPTSRNVAELMERTSFQGTRMASTAIDAVSVVLAPFHECVTSNARRLSARRG
jgi:hypothetical protein